MSLQIWLPLNEDLHNQGLYSINPTLNTSNTIFTDGGKLGSKAITITKGTSDGINLPNYMNQLKTFENYSMCAWIYMTDFASGHSSTIISSGRWAQTNNLNDSCIFGLYYKNNDTYQNILIPNLVTWNTKIIIPTDKRMSLNKWYHIAITYDGIVTKAYINGEYIGQNSRGGITQQSNTTTVRIGSATYVTDYTFNGKINDVRIYNHALSAAEVAEIAKGLVLHYKLDQSNSTIIYDCSGYQNNGTIVGNLTAAAGSPRYGTATQFPGTTYLKCISPSAEGQTISVWAKWNSIPSGQSIIYIDYKTKTGLGLMNTGILCSSCGLNSYTFSKATIMANIWYHFVIVCPNGSENATRQLYINGVEQTATNSTSNWTYATDELQIGKRNTTSDGFNGQLSDFRIYTTAFTPEQIADLYHTSMSIDNQGNIYARELIEL